MPQYRFVVGDWSDDGHKEKEFFTVETNVTADKIRQAYREATKLLDFALSNPNGHHWLKTGHTPKLFMTDEFGHNLNQDAVKWLREMGYEFDPEGNLPNDDGTQSVTPTDYLRIFMWMVGKVFAKKKTPFEWKKIDPPECINGFWNKKLNVSFGYEYYMDAYHV